MMFPFVPSVQTITRRWLLRLRWVGVAGQVATLLVAGLLIGLQLPWIPLLVIIGLTALSNGVLQHRSKKNAAEPEWLLAAIIGADVLLLTALIYFTGGASNPFTSLYLVLIALAAMSLDAEWLLGVVLLATLGYMFVHFYGHPLRGPGGIGSIGCPAYGLHLQGMVVAFFLTTFCVAYFVRHMHRSLRLRNEALTAAEARAAKADQFSSLAALAAGVAHELGSPLGTIAVVARELEFALARLEEPVLLEDARLVRQEVERCRGILDRLDSRSTGSMGDPVEACTMAGLMDAVRGALLPVMVARLVVSDATHGCAFQLPRQPVVQALVVLVQNACEADASGAAVEVCADPGDDGLRIRVLDSGPGMSAHVLKHAGEPFFTTKAPRQGMGLGLFLVRTLARQLGGHLEHENQMGGGTAATLHIPCTHL